jgi:uncharacterized membrane protein
VVANPLFSVASLLEEQKLLYIAKLGAPLAFFAWRRPIGWLSTLPAFLLTLVTASSLPSHQIAFQYTAHWFPFLFLALLANLAWVRRPVFAGDIHGATRQRAWLSTIALLTIFTSFQWGGLLQQNTLKAGMDPFRFGTTEEDRGRYAKLSSLIAKVPPRAKLASSDNLVPHVANRPDAYALSVGLFDAEYLLASLPARGEEATKIREAFASSFGVVESDGAFLLAKRGYSQKRNAAALSHVH